MLMRSLIASLLFVVPVAASAAAQTTKPEDQTAVALTVYQQNLALIRETRRIALPSGRSRLAVIGVPTALLPETVLVNGATAGRLRVIGQVYESALLSPEALLRAAVGGTVLVVTTNREDGTETFSSAEVLRAQGREALLRLDGRIRSLDVRRIAFESAPPNLRARPTLVLDLESTVAGAETLMLSYLTGGMNWRADYVARLNRDEAEIQLAAWVTVANSTGTTFKDARLRVIAGAINKVRQTRNTAPVRAMMARDEKARHLPIESAISDLRIFEFADPVTLGGKETRQLALLPATAVKVEKEYRLYGNNSHFGSIRRDTVRANPAVLYRFKNTAADGLGRSLPEGTIRLYVPSEGGDIFRGEDRIRHTPTGETVTINAGLAVDITSQRKQTDFRRKGLPKNTVESAHAITLRNAKDKAATVILIERIPGDWNILSESHTHSKRTANEAQWRVSIPAGGKAELTYRVRTRF